MTYKKDSQNPYEMSQEELLSRWDYRIIKFIVFCIVACLWWTGMTAP